MNVGFFLCKHLPPHLLLLAFIPPQQHKTLHEQQKRRINCSGSVSNFGFLRCPFLCLTTRGRDPPVLICAEGRDRGKKIGMSWITPSALFVHVQYTYALLLAGGHDPPVLIGWVCSHQHPLYRHTRHSKPHKAQQATQATASTQDTQGTASHTRHSKLSYTMGDDPQHTQPKNAGTLFCFSLQTHTPVGV